jgi:phosphatidate cytidylyltransferase
MSLSESDPPVWPELPDRSGRVSGAEGISGRVGGAEGISGRVGGAEGISGRVGGAEDISGRVGAAGGGDEDARHQQGARQADAAPVPLNGGRIRHRRGRPSAGRNLPAAIGVGLVLGAVVVASLFVWRPAFLGVLVLAIAVATWEMVRAVAPSGARPPLVPLLAGGIAMCALAWYGGAETLTLGLLATVIAVLVWRIADGPAGYQRDTAVGVLIAVYVPFLAGFAALLVRPPDGDLRVICALAAVVMSDTGGYVFGVFFGKHPMAPSVSPKKSWEGLVGSLLTTGIGGAILLYFVLHVPPWYGALFGLAVSAAAILGDLAESLLKRDLGIKDMSHLLPGHGGVMDRVDSILFAAPAAYAVLQFVLPGAG